MSIANYLLRVVPVFFLSFSLSAQNTRIENKIMVGHENGPSPAAFQKAAQKALDGKDYYSALRYYEKALQADTTQELLMAYGRVAYQLTAYEKAEAAYRAVTVKYPQSSNAAYLSLADALYHQGRYNEAKDTYAKYLTLKDNSQSDKDYAEKMMENALWAMGKTSGQSTEIEIDVLSESVNTPYSEFAPFLQNGKLYFSSYQFPFPTDNHSPNRKLIKVQTYTSNQGIEETVQADFNTDKRHTAHTAFNRSGNAMYFTHCDYVNTADVQCKIYVRYKSADGSWSNAVELPASINVANANNTEPNVGYDEKSQQEILFFASDRMGGMGKRDLYYSLILDDGGFSDPINLGSVNSAADEVSPFFHNGKQTLYFASNGWESLGGYDIYSTQGKGTNWSAPVSLPSPINTSYNELYYIENEAGTEAYFSSNRPGAMYLDTLGCCYDIFKAKLVQPEMIAVTFDKESGDSLFITTLYLYEQSGNEEMKQQVSGSWSSFPLIPGKNYTLVAEKDGYTSDTIAFNTMNWEGLMVQKLYLKPSKIRLIANAFDGSSDLALNGTTIRFVDLGLVTKDGTLATPKTPLLDNSTNESGHSYTYSLDYNHKYKVLIMKNGYTSDSVEISTVGMKGAGVIEKDLYLRRGLNLEVRAFDVITKAPLLGTSIEFLEIGGATLTGNNPTSNDYYYNIGNQKHYRIVVRKEGYFPETVEFTAVGDPSLTVQTILKQLYLRPINLSAFLPIRVYFDNDEPDKRTTRRTTQKSYDDTYYPYYAQKGIFSNEYSTSYAGMEQSLAASKVEDFFENDVRGGFERLELFSENLVEMLKNGQQITLVIKGFASPRAQSDYNNHLTARRIASLKNHFAIYKGGILKPYLDSGALNFVEEPFGEDTAPSDISDKYDDRVNSIYSIKASKERRVEIIDVKRN